MPERNFWRQWATEPPPRDARWGIGAGILHDGVRWQTYQLESRVCADGAFVWTHTEQHGDSTCTVHGEYNVWKFAGDPMPTPDEQRNGVIIWEWNSSPGRLRSLCKTKGQFICLLPVDVYLPWVVLKTNGAEAIVLEDGRTLCVLTE